jgi:fructan beta-fructosidase
MDTYRPLYHFSPVSGWLNDPNGLIWHDGEYHMFYQWHPSVDVDVAGMCWHHAVSPDVVHWQHLDIALEPDSLGAIWSGSAAADTDNTSGLFQGAGGFVAVFTHHAPSNAERQSLAYSADRGRTWTRYPGNPVLGDDACRDFRDPKVFWHAPTQRWIMIVGVEHQLFASPNLRDWTLLGKPGFKSECPDLFPLAIEGTDEILWGLSLGGRQVVIGTFDGRTFTPQSERVEVDAAPDFYAAQSWENVPGGRRIWIGWLNNWQYAQKLPPFGARRSRLRSYSLCDWTREQSTPARSGWGDNWPVVIRWRSWQRSDPRLATAAASRWLSRASRRRSSVTMRAARFWTATARACR